MDDSILLDAVMTDKSVRKSMVMLWRKKFLKAVNCK